MGISDIVSFVVSSQTLLGKIWIGRTPRLVYRLPAAVVVINLLFPGLWVLFSLPLSGSQATDHQLLGSIHQSASSGADSL